MKIPKWIGPALSPVVLVILIAIVCCYYCYWKPRREKKRKKNQAEEKQLKKKMISPSLARPRITKGKNVLHADEEMSYGCGSYDYNTYTTYEPYCLDYCPLPSSGLSYCVHDCRPKVVYCPKTSYLAKSRDTALDQSSRCKLGTDKARKYRVRCPKGECIKCPDLPVIKEGNSTPSLRDEKEEEEEMSTGLICVCGESENEDRENEEAKSTSTLCDSVQDVTSNCCEDSGIEDH